MDASSNLIAQTSSGRVRGSVSAHARVFRGIPYAAAPVGQLRFAPPRPHAGWTGVRDATQPGPNAPQPRRGQFGRLDISPFFGPGWSRADGDDYLTLDIWTPMTPAERPAPVMVFVHGGAFIAGSTRAPFYDGEAFARDGAVFVTVNYRLGIPGFLHLPDVPGNRGRADVLAAVAWVHENAAAFGGDAHRITLAGQSAGAMIVASIVADPLSGHHARRAILQSGSGLCAFTPKQAQIVTDAVGRALGVKPAAASLARFDDERLVEVATALAPIDLTTGPSFDPLGGIAPFSLVLDRQPAELLAQRVAQSPPPAVDLLIGNNHDEGGLYLAPLPGFNESTDADVMAAAARLHPRPAELVQAYRRARLGASNAELRVALLGDGVFGYGTRRFAQAHARGPAPTFVYEFVWRPDSLGGTLGACHLAELPFVFDRTELAEFHGPERLLGITPPPVELAIRMHAAWVQFAATGNPGWPEFTPDSPVVQEIGETWTERLNPHAAEYAAWD